MARFIVALVFFSLFYTSTAMAECRQFIELWSASKVAQELGRSEEWVVSSYKVNVWAKKTEDGKFPKVGEMRAGSRAILLEISDQDFKVKSPFDGSIGWIGQDQVSSILRQDDQTFEPCN